MTWIALVNPAAGSKATTVEYLAQCAADRGVDIVFHQTSDVSQVAPIIERAVTSGHTRFVAVGGDGTLHSLVNALPLAADSGRFTVGLVPGGSGSDLARMFGHTSDAGQAFDRLASPELYPIDIGRIRFADGAVRYFVNVADVGVAAAAVRTAERLPRWLGQSKYTVAFWLTLGKAMVPTVDVSVDHHRFEGPAINVVVANGQFFGGGMNIAPRASMVDGLLDVQVFSGRKRQAFTVMPRILTGSHLTHKAVRRYVGGTVTIVCDADVDVEADGELVGTGPVTIDVVSEAIHLVI